ncbi:helix-turn-helix domain-containing protein [Chryseobacterium bernardetii]|uniref:helix-turn-helix domain-containing protein n=1 Tax=Chryseobacterium bernardetii TaxID=1241978 RepID=UPI003AFB3D0B
MEFLQDQETVLFGQPLFTYLLRSYKLRRAEVRKDKKMSQDEVGKLVGVHDAVIGRYERGEVKPSIKMATQLGKIDQ